jgi:8-oxo-dGTP pyrophosphatase MutT (NUDIX family)
MLGIAARVFGAHRFASMRLPGFVPAAVLLILWPQAQGAHLLFIRRSRHVRHHKGEISFPGGRWEPPDADLSETALREAREEVGVCPEELTVVGRLDDAFSFSRFAIAPFVAIAPRPPRLRPNGEVAELLPLPLKRLDPQAFSAEHRLLDGAPVTVYSCQVDGRIIWGATARILKGFLEILHKDPEARAALASAEPLPGPVSR